MNPGECPLKLLMTQKSKHGQLKNYVGTESRIKNEFRWHLSSYVSFLVVRATLMGTWLYLNEPNGPQKNQLRWTVGEDYEIYKMQNRQPDTFVNLYNIDKMQLKCIFLPKWYGMVCTTLPEPLVPELNLHTSLL